MQTWQSMKEDVKRHVDEEVDELSNSLQYEAIETTEDFFDLLSAAIIVPAFIIFTSVFCVFMNMVWGALFPLYFIVKVVVDISKFVFWVVKELVVKIFTAMCLFA